MRYIDYLAPDIQWHTQEYRVPEEPGVYRIGILVGSNYRRNHQGSGPSEYLDGADSAYSDSFLVTK